MTLKPKSVISAMTTYYEEHPGCSDRALHSFAQTTAKKVEGARHKIAAAIGAEDPRTIIFTKNATESINMLAQMLPFERGDTILTTDLEHNSNLLPWQFLQYKKGVNFRRLPIRPDQEGFDLNALEQALKENRVKLVSCFHASNVTGMLLPVKEMIRAAHQHGALFLLDAAQSAASEKIDVSDVDVDFLACSVHKMFGPTGVGVLYGKAELLDSLTPYHVGGGGVLDVTYDSCTLAAIPHKFETGLLDYAGIIGAGAAVDFLESIDLLAAKEHVGSLNRFVSEELAQCNGVTILGPHDPSRRGGIVNIVVSDRDVAEIGLMLDTAARIMVRTGVHCAHAWYHQHKLLPSLRASFSIYNTLDEAETFVKNLRAIVRGR
jgi:cysteine desulfurase/selenocysteine lyase